MAGLSTVTIQTATSNNYNISFDESICGILFDIGSRDGFFDDLPTISEYFGNEQLQVINNLDEAEAMGLLDSDVLNGVVAYHIKTYYNYIDKEQELYIMFADCSNGFDAIQEMQTLSNNKLYQIGIWTEQTIFEKGSGNVYDVNDVIGNIQSNVKELANIDGAVSNVSAMLSVLLFCNVGKLSDSDDAVSYKKFPNLIKLNAPKVSVVLGQEGSDAVHNIQDNNVDKTPVGILGFAMACLTLASAENSIGDVGQFDLNKLDTLQNPEFGFGTNYTPIDNDNIIKIRRNVLAQKGYILLTDYEAKAGGVFLSNDQTLSDGDYSTISNNRLMHKVGRIIRRSLLPYVNASIPLESTTGYISSSMITELSNAIYEMIDGNMVTPKGQSQLSGRVVSISQNQNIINTDSLSASVTITPVTSNSEITVVETVQL